MADWRVGADRNLPIARTDRPWDGDEARRQIFAWAGWPDNPDPSKAKRGFLIYDAERAKEKGAYKLPFAMVFDGQLKAVPSGLRAAASRLPQTDAPQDVLERARKVLDHYFERLEQMQGKASPEAPAHPLGLRVKVQLPGGVVRRAPAGQATKAMKAWDDLVDGHLVRGLPYGGQYAGRDSYGETFLPDTEIWMRVGDVTPVTYFHGFGPDEPGKVQDPPVVVGLARYLGQDETGFWFHVRYDPDEPLARSLLEADPNILRASSGAVGHLVRVKKGGLISVWPVGELAIFHADQEWRQPANDYARVAPWPGESAWRSVAQTLPGMSISSILIEEEEPMDEKKKAPIAPEMEAPAAEAKAASQEAAVDVEAIAKMVAEQLAPVAQEAAKRAVEEVLDRIPATAPGMPVSGVKKRVHQGGKYSFVVEDLGQAIRAMAQGRAAYVEIPLDERAFMKLVQEGVDTAGGFLVPPEYGQRLADMLQESMKVVPLMTRLGVASKEGSWPKVVDGSTVYWVDEATAIGESGLTFGQLTWTAYKAAALVPITQEMIEDSPFAVRQIVERQIVRDLSLEADKAVLRGNGTSPPITGIRHTSGVHIIDLDPNGKVPDFDDFSLALSKVEGLPLPEDGFRWVLAPALKHTLRGVKDANGNPLWVDYAQGMPGSILGVQPVWTSVIPTNLVHGTATNATEIYVGAWRDAALFLERRSLRVEFNPTYDFQKELAAVKATWRFALAVEYPEAFAVVIGAKVS